MIGSYNRFGKLEACEDRTVSETRLFDAPLKQMNMGSEKIIRIRPQNETSRCLSDRHRNTRFKNWSASVTSGIPRIAVLPFGNFNQDPALDWLCRNLSHTFIAGLALTPDLMVLRDCTNLNGKQVDCGDLFNSGQSIDYILTGDFSWMEDTGELQIEIHLLDQQIDKYLGQYCFGGNGDPSLFRVLDQIIHDVRSSIHDYSSLQNLTGSVIQNSEIDFSGVQLFQYKVTRELGSGGMGTVYLAEDTLLNRKVALKFIHRRFNQESQHRLMEEARLTAAIDHPYICNIHEVKSTSEGVVFIVMEYVRGESLRERLLRTPLSIIQALKLANQLAEALEIAHRMGIVHRDLKPENIMMTEQDHPKVMDFGAARWNPKWFQINQIKTIQERPSPEVGTWAYMAPEQIRDLRTDHRIDIFSFGILLFEILTSVHPFRRVNPAETIGAILHLDQPPIRTYRKGLPKLLEYSISKMLAKNPNQRYQAFEEIRAVLTILINRIETKHRLKGSLWSFFSIFIFLLVLILGIFSTT